MPWEERQWTFGFELEAYLWRRFVGKHRFYYVDLQHQLGFYRRPYGNQWFPNGDLTCIVNCRNSRFPMAKVLGKPQATDTDPDTMDLKHSVSNLQCFQNGK